MRREDEVKPAPALLLRAGRLGAGEAQVEVEGEKVTLPAEEPHEDSNHTMTSATIAQLESWSADNEFVEEFLAGLRGGLDCRSWATG